MAADQSYKKAIDEVSAGIDKILGKLNEADKALIRLAGSAKSFSNGLKITSPQGLTASVKEYETLIDRINRVSKTQSTKHLELLDAQKKKQHEVNQMWQRGLAAKEREAKALEKVSGAYHKLVQKQKEARTHLRNLIASGKANNAQLKQAQREYDRLSAKVNQANKATSNFSKNSLGGMVRGFKNLISAFGIFLGAQGIVMFGKSIFNTIKTLQSLDFSLKAVTGSQKEFTRVQTFLSDITDKFGLSLISVTERYTKFLAAAKQSGITIKDTEDIFRSMSKASAVLGLKTHELEGVYLALEQMLSKGKVTTEELRRQLGERLPGAFGVMAKALGVTITKLDEMLKKGQVISAEALPKFAKAYEEAIGIQQIEKVDTLVAAQERLSNSWLNWVKNLESSQGRISKVFISIATGLGNLLDLLADFNLTEEDALSKFNEGLKTESATEQLHRLELQAMKTGLSLEEVARLNLAEFSFKTKAAEAEVNNLKRQMKDLEKEGAGRSRKAIRGYRKEMEFLKDAMKDATRDLAVYGGALQTINDILNKSEAFIPLDEDTAEKGIKAIKGSIAWLEELIKKLEEEQSKLATSDHAYHGYALAIEQAKENLAELSAQFEIMSEKGGKVKLTLETPDLADVQKARQEIFRIWEQGWDDRVEKAKEINDAITKIEDDKRKERATKERIEAEQRIALMETVFNAFSQYYDIDLDKFKFLVDHKKNTTAEWADATVELTRAVLQASLNRYEIELQEAQRARDIITNNDLASEKEKRIAKEKFEEEERRIKTERAKAERNNTLIQIAVDTAAAVAKALAQTGVLAPAVIPTLIGIGLAQAAIVAAQPLPKFAQGTTSPLSADTLAWVGDGGRSEAITKDGKLLGVTPDKPTLAMLPKGAEVHKDAKAFGEEALQNAIFKMNMAADGQFLNTLVADAILVNEIKGMRDETKRTWEEVKRLASRPINVNNRVKLEKEFSHYQQ